VAVHGGTKNDMLQYKKNPVDGNSSRISNYEKDLSVEAYFINLSMKTSFKMNLIWPYI
jgi:hypothetical protein